MALDVTTNPRRWYSNYTKEVVKSHTRTVQWPSENTATESVTSLQHRPNDASEDVFLVDNYSMENGEGGNPTRGVDELTSSDAGLADRNNNTDSLNQSDDVIKSLPPFSVGEPTWSRVDNVERHDVSLSADLETDRRRSWISGTSGKKAFWASVGNDKDDDDLLKYKISRKNTSSDNEDIEPPMTPSRSPAPSLLVRTYSSILSGDNRCKTCDQRLYEMEKVVADHVAYHKRCFRCHQCQRILSLASFISIDGKPCCKSHLKDLVTGKTTSIPVTPVCVPDIRTNSHQNGLGPFSDIKEATRSDSSYGIIEAKQEMTMPPPKLVEVKLLKQNFESPISDSGPVKDKFTGTKTKNTSLSSAVSEPFSSRTSAVDESHGDSCDEPSSKALKRVHFIDDMTGMYIVNPDPEDPTDSTSGLFEAPGGNGSDYDDDVIEEREEESEVFLNTQTTPMLLHRTEPETEVIAVADAFEIFRRLDQMIDEDEDVPRERKPVRKITPPREEPTLYERYQQITASKTDASVPTVPAAEIILGADAGLGRESDGQAKTPEGAANKPATPPGNAKEVSVTSTRHLDELDFNETQQPTSGKHQGDSGRPEPGTIRTLLTRWKMIDAGQAEILENNRNNSLTPSVVISSGSPNKLYPEEYASRDREEHQKKTPALAAASSVDGAPSSAADRSSKTRHGLPASLAFTKNRLAEFRLLESLHLEKPPEVVRHKTFKWTVKEPVIIHRQSVVALATSITPIIMPSTNSRVTECHLPQTSKTDEDAFRPAAAAAAAAAAWSAEDNREHDLDELPSSENMFVLLEKFRMLESSSLPPPVPVNSRTAKMANSVSGYKHDRYIGTVHGASSYGMDSHYYRDDFENGFSNNSSGSAMINGHSDDSVKVNNFK